MPTYARTASEHRFASGADPAERCEAAILLFTRKPIGLKFTHELEYDYLQRALKALPDADRAKIFLTYVRRPKAGRRAGA